MYVSVLNEAGAPVPDLGPSDFIIREDNATREVLRVAPADEPMQIVLLIDNSQAARDNIPNIRQALPPFVATLTGAAEGDVKNEIAVVAIAERPTIFTTSTTNRANLQKGIDRLWSLRGTGAYLLDGSSRSARASRSATRDGRSSSRSRPRVPSSATAITSRSSIRCTRAARRSMPSSSDSRRAA